MGKFDSYAEFTSANSDAFDLPDGLTNTDLGSVSIWLRYSTASRSHIFFGCGGTCGDGYGGENELHINTEDGGGILLRIEGGSNDLNCASNGSINDNELHHVVATWNIAGNGVLYIDGIQNSTDTHDAFSFVTTTDNYLGRPTNATRIWDGRLYEVTHWDHELTALDVQLLHRLGRTRRSLSGYLPFEVWQRLVWSTGVLPVPISIFN